jgi:hypothetical protein
VIVAPKKKDLAEGRLFYDMPITHASIMKITKDGVIKVQEGQTVIIFTATELPVEGAKK